MRKVKYYKWTGSTSDMERKYIGDALFHDWGVNNGHSAAIIELDDGSILYPTADMIQFIEPENMPLSYDDAVNVAKGCKDYSGGYRDRQLSIFHHGMETVVNALKSELGDLQSRTLHRIGSQED